MNDTQKLQEHFFNYINCDDSKKENVITDCLKVLPNQEKLIIRLKNIVDNLNNKDSLHAFINNIFDIKNDIIRMDLLDNIESQINNRTTAIKKIETKEFETITFDTSKIEKKTSEVTIAKNEINYDGKNMKIEEISDEDNRFYNYIIEKLFGISDNELIYAHNEDKKYLLSDEVLPDISNNDLVKEDALCRTNEIEYLVDRITENKDKRKYVKRIFLDLITNQNYRILSNGLGVINSTNRENEYYVLNGITLKKEIAIDSLYLNYYEDIKEIAYAIINNYDLIMNLITDILRTRPDIDKSYLMNLQHNIVEVYEKGRTKQSLEEINTGKSMKNNYTMANILKNNIDEFKQSLNIKTLKKEKSGYSNIFILLSGVILFGILFAYLMVKR